MYIPKIQPGRVRLFNSFSAPKKLGQRVPSLTQKLSEIRLADNKFADSEKNIARKFYASEDDGGSSETSTSCNGVYGDNGPFGFAC